MFTDPLIDLHIAHSQRVWGKYAGRVASADDTEQSGRLQVVCPAILGSAAVWARPCVPYAGPGVGFFFLPPDGANVWIEFEGGDPSRPIWTGCFWGKGELPAEAASRDIKLIKTAMATLTIDDSEGSLEITNASEVKTTWAETVVTEAGGASHSVAAAGVVAESTSGAGKLEVSDSGISVNSGAFTVV